jgi:hypothetical protein
MDANLLREVGLNFTAEFLGDDVGCQLRVKGLEGSPVIQIIRLERGARDNSGEKLVMGFAGNGVDGKVEAIEAFLVVILQGGGNSPGQRSNLLLAEGGHGSMSFRTCTHFVESNRGERNVPVDFSDAGDISLSKFLFDLDKILPIIGPVLLVIGGTGIQEPFHLIRRNGITDDLEMGMEDGASSGKKEILTDLPIAGIRIKRRSPSNDLDSNRKTLFVNFGRKLGKAEKMLTTEDHDTSVGSDWVEIRKTDCPSDANPSFRNDFFYELRSLLKNILRTEEALF